MQIIDIGDCLDVQLNDEDVEKLVGAKKDD